MSVASHLAVTPAKYDTRIRSLIPLYDELIAEVAGALGHASRPVRMVVDLGIGTGALARACLEHAPGARPGGVLINGDCAPASTPRGSARDLDVWFSHLGKTFGSRARGRRVYESWAEEDTYVPLAEEIRLLKRAGFTVDVPWRRSPSAVIVGCRAA